MGSAVAMPVTIAMLMYVAKEEILFLEFQIKSF